MASQSKQAMQKVTALYRYPVKGFSPEPRERRCASVRTSSSTGRRRSASDRMENEIRLPGLTLVGVKRTGRYAATNVDPKTGRRDMQIPRSLTAQYEHENFGIYRAVKSNGAIAVGDEVEGGA